MSKNNTACRIEWYNGNLYVWCYDLESTLILISRKEMKATHKLAALYKVYESGRVKSIPRPNRNLQQQTRRIK